MADKLYSGLGPRAAVLTTDILAFLPLGGPPAEQADVTALLSDASSVLSINRDSRQLVNSVGTISLDWELTLLSTAGSNRLDWSAGQLYDAAAGISVNWEGRLLHKADGSLAVDWENMVGILDPLFIDQPGRLLIDSTGLDTLNWDDRILTDSSSVDSMDWENRQLFDSTGATVLDFSTQQPSSGPQTAGAVYTATEQVMIQEMYDALLAYGLLSP